MCTDLLTALACKYADLLCKYRLFLKILSSFSCIYLPVYTANVIDLVSLNSLVLGEYVVPGGYVMKH
jgi:hypothetical protein